MSNKDPEKDYSNLTDALRFAFEQLTKNLYISIPGIIDSYNFATKRAIVHPAIKVITTDGTAIQHSSIVNVPVIWPSGGGFTIVSPLPKGEPVTIFFSQRGITKFKEVFTESDPGIGLFDKEDAYIIAGFGGLSITPATEDGISMQQEDGTDFIYIENNKIRVETPGIVEIDSLTKTEDVAGNSIETIGINKTITVTGTTSIDSLLNTRIAKRLTNNITLPLVGATPLVALGNNFTITDTVSKTFFSGGLDSQIIRIVALAAVKIVNSATLKLKGAADYDMVIGDTLTMQNIASTTWYELSRSVNS